MAKLAGAVWWIRRDLRLQDNQALTAALGAAEQVIPLFVLDPRLLASEYAGAKRVAFLFAGLRALDAALERLGSRLIVRRGDPAEVLPAFLAESGSTAVYAEEDYAPYARRRDSAVGKLLPLHLTGGLSVHPPEMVLKGDGSPYTVFTPFSKAWKSLPRPNTADLLPAPRKLNSPQQLPSLPIPASPAHGAEIPFPAGTDAALHRLEWFMAGENSPISQYHEQRDRPDIDGTSALSPYIRMGMISLRQAVVAAGAALARAPGKGPETFLNELIWREFYLSILAHFPHVRQGSFRPQYDAIVWRNDPDEFAAWQEGRTGYPIVDAAMRQLVQSGWMHNRARMIVASFLVKDLLVDWRWGEKFFMQHLLDGDPAANNGGWQWSAGTGTDAAPYFRIFNPLLQSKKFDPHGFYIRRWLPELSQVSLKFIHEPWTMPPDLQAEAGCIIGQDYPQPLVDHATARQRTLSAYKQAGD